MNYKMKHIKSFNESVKDVLKPKSNEDILDSIKNLPDYQKMIKACKHHMTWLVKKLIDDGVDASFNDNMCLINCGILGYDDIVEILMKNQNVIKQLYKTQIDKAIENLDYNYYYSDEDGDEEEAPDEEMPPVPVINWYYGDEDDEEDYEEDYEE